MKMIALATGPAQPGRTKTHRTALILHGAKCNAACALLFDWN